MANRVPKIDAPNFFSADMLKTTRKEFINLKKIREIMDFEKLCKEIDKGKSLRIHKYYQKIIALLFINKHDPFGRRLLQIKAEKKYGKGVADLFLKWEHEGKTFMEIIEIEVSPKKKTLEEKIKLYSKKADLFSLCIPSKKLPGLLKVFSKMRAQLPKIKIVYIMHDAQIRKNSRKMVKDKHILIGAYSPFMLSLCPDGNVECIIKNAGTNRNLFFNALLRDYLK